ncbi:hypothetical protein Fcan01_27670 [Folsomia candida]|uniref:Uncharacterized protein n=1 Tax=Folsomia candida TaxID=158441 RepID=A0A226CZY2_FOLCA|nr:hypothetical protein Fcan01_27670 [Folsomia candida]
MYCIFLVPIDIDPVPHIADVVTYNAQPSLVPGGVVPNSQIMQFPKASFQLALIVLISVVGLEVVWAGGEKCSDGSTTCLTCRCNWYSDTKVCCPAGCTFNGWEGKCEGLVEAQIKEFVPCCNSKGGMERCA